MRSVLRALIVVVAAALGVAATDAQAQGRNGTIVGRVTDAEGRPVAGARVGISRIACAPCIDGAAGQSTETNRDGEYGFVNVPPGIYEVRARALAKDSATLVFWRRRDVTLVFDAVVRADPILEPARLQVALVAYRPDGRILATATTSQDVPSGFLWVDPVLCAPVAGVPRRSTAPLVGWSVSGAARGASDETQAVSVTWQRRWMPGKQPGPKTGTLTTKIPLGERFYLDFVELAPSRDCPVSAARLEVSVVPPAPTVENDERAEALRAQQRAARGLGPGREQASATGSLPDEVASLRDQRATALRHLMDARPVAPEQTATGPLFEAELWLVHKLPDGTERSELIRQPVRDTASFVFPAIHLTSAAGTNNIEVFGFVRRVAGGGVAASLQVAIGQRHVGTAAGEAYSGSGKTLPWPAATEVLSFELPPDNRLPPGHRFDLRLRLTPR